MGFFLFFFSPSQGKGGTGYATNSVYYTMKQKEYSGSKRIKVIAQKGADLGSYEYSN